MSNTTPFKRLDREALVQFLDEKRKAIDTYGIVALSIYDAMHERITRGDFDMEDQRRCVECGRFTKTPHDHTVVDAPPRHPLQTIIDNTFVEQPDGSFRTPSGMEGRPG